MSSTTNSLFTFSGQSMGFVPSLLNNLPCQSSGPTTPVTGPNPLFLFIPMNDLDQSTIT